LNIFIKIVLLSSKKYLMKIPLKLMFVTSISVLLIFTLFHSNLKLSFEKTKVKNSFADKNVIPICCAWGPELQKGFLTYSIQGKGSDKKIIDGVTNAVESWNKNLHGIQIKKTTSAGNGDILISVIRDGKQVAGKTVNSIDSNGFIRKSYVTLSKVSFNEPFSPTQLEQVAEHELGHVLGLNHANFNGNLMSSQVQAGSAIISSCVIDAVNTANAWMLKDGGVSLHGPTKTSVRC
jgi:hypothetical protein